MSWRCLCGHVEEGVEACGVLCALVQSFAVRKQLAHQQGVLQKAGTCAGFQGTAELNL